MRKQDQELITKLRVILESDNEHAKTGITFWVEAIYKALPRKPWQKPASRKAGAK